MGLMEGLGLGLELEVRVRVGGWVRIIGLGEGLSDFSVSCPVDLGPCQHHLLHVMRPCSGPS